MQGGGGNILPLARLCIEPQDKIFKGGSVILSSQVSIICRYCPQLTQVCVLSTRSSLLSKFTRNPFSPALFSPYPSCISKSRFWRLFATEPQFTNRNYARVYWFMTRAEIPVAPD